MQCPLCCSSETQHFYEDNEGCYHQCKRCDLVFSDMQTLLNKEDEKARYDLHQNEITDLGYRHFLEKMFRPISQRYEVGTKGLEYGCGPGPLLFEMFVEAGYDMQKFDTYYANTPEVLLQKYDFITMTEVIEHLYKPNEVLEKLREALNPGGSIGVMTNLYSDVEMFASWWYKKDPTHVSFFHQKTLEWVAQMYDMELEIVEKNVFLFKNR